MIYSTVGRSRIAVMLAQAAIDLVTCVLAALIAGRIAPAGENAHSDNCIVAGRAVSVHRELHSSDRHRNSRGVLHDACAADARLDFHRASARRVGRARDRSAGYSACRQMSMARTLASGFAAAGFVTGLGTLKSTGINCPLTNRL